MASPVPELPPDGISTYRAGSVADKDRADDRVWPEVSFRWLPATQAPPFRGRRRSSAGTLSGEPAAVSDGDELVLNRALEPKDGSVVVAGLDGELTIKRLRITPTGVVLQADNPRFPNIEVPALAELTI